MVTRKSERTSSKNKNNLHTKPRFEDKRNGLLLLYTKAASVSKNAAIKKELRTPPPATLLLHTLAGRM